MENPSYLPPMAQAPLGVNPQSNPLQPMPGLPSGHDAQPAAYPGLPTTLPSLPSFSPGHSYAPMPESLPLVPATPAPGPVQTLPPVPAFEPDVNPVPQVPAPAKAPEAESEAPIDLTPPLEGLVSNETEPTRDQVLERLQTNLAAASGLQQPGRMLRHMGDVVSDEMIRALSKECPEANPHQLEHEIHATLGQLQQQVRRYLMLKGTSRWFHAIAAVSVGDLIPESLKVALSALHESDVKQVDATYSQPAHPPAKKKRARTPRVAAEGDGAQPAKKKRSRSPRKAAAPTTEATA